MASQQALADLVVRLQMESSQYREQLDRSNAAIRRFEREQSRNTRNVEEGFTSLQRAQRRALDSMSSGLKKYGAALAAAASVNALKNMVQNSIDAMNAMDDFSTRIGISVEALSHLQFAAESSGIKMAELQMALQRQTRRTAEAAKGTGEAVKAFEALNLSATAMTKLSPDEQLRAIAQAMQNVSDQGERVALAFKLWDSGGVKMLQMIDDLDTLTAQAEELGLTISTDMAQSATAFNAQIVKIKSVFSAVAKVVSGELLGALTSVTDKAVEFAQVIVEKIKFKGSLEQLKEMRDSLQQGIAFAKPWENILTFGGVDRAREKVEALNKEIAEIENNIKKAGSPDLGYKFDPTAVYGADAPKESASKSRSTGDKAAAQEQRQKDSAQKKLASLQHQLAAEEDAIKSSMDRRLKTLDESYAVLGAKDADYYDIKADIMQAAADAQAKIDEAATEKAQGTLDKLLEQLEGEESAIEASYSRRLEMLKDANKVLGLEQEKYAEFVRAIGEKRRSEEEDAEKEKLQGRLSLAGEFTDRFASLAKGESSKLLEVQRAGAIVSATISGASAYMKALDTGGPIAGPAMAAMIAAQTAIQIATIAGARAMGGPVSAGKTYLVGERGPELFKPSASGDVISNSALGGMGNINVNIVEDSSRAGQVEKGEDNITVYVQAAIQQLHNDLNSGRGIFSAMEGKYGLAR